MARRPSFSATLVAALAVHTVAIGLLARLTPPQPVADSSAPVELLQVELTASFGGSGAAASGSPANGARALGARPEPHAVVASRSRVASRGPELLTSLGPSEASAPEPSEPRGEPPSARPEREPGRRRGPGLTLEQLGVGVSNPMLAGPPPPRERPPADHGVAPGVERSMAAAQARHDARVGLGPHGPVVSALAVAVRRTAGPTNGRAVYDATIDGNGKLLHIAVVEVSGSYASWQRAAQLAAANLAGRSLPKPAGGRPIALRIEVTAREQLPSGADPGLAVDVLGVPVKKGKGKKSTRITILAPPKPEMVTVATPDGTYEIPWAQPIPGVGLAGDPADIGATAVRMVHARLVSARVL